MSHRTAMYAIVPTDASCKTAGPVATRLAAVAQQTGGTRVNICKSDYSGVLAQIAQRASGLQRDFHLSQTPTDVNDIRVSVGGKRVYPPTWTYDGSSNTVVFSATAVPNPGQTITIRYRSVCATTP
jgi:hypothetical protein